MAEFTIGMKVVVISERCIGASQARKGMTGVMRGEQSYGKSLAIEMDDPNFVGHDCDGMMPQSARRKGYFIFPQDLRPFDPPRPGSVEEYIQRALS